MAVAFGKADGLGPEEPEEAVGVGVPMFEEAIHVPGSAADGVGRIPFGMSAHPGIPYLPSSKRTKA